MNNIRYFMISYHIHTHGKNGFGYITGNTHDGKYINQQILISEIQKQYGGMVKVIILNIIEFCENDFKDFIETFPAVNDEKTL